MDPSNPNRPKAPSVTVPPEVALGEYANFVSIAHNFSEVVLDFGRTIPGREDIPIVARMVMTPLHARQLLRALTHNLSLYEQTFGTIPDPPKPPSGPESPPGGTSNTN
jgi:hypothetical protein